MTNSDKSKEIKNIKAGRSKAPKDVFVIGVGASAGGLQAFSELFSTVPNDSVAYVIVQHLSSQHISMLTDLVSRQTILQVQEAQDNMLVEANKVYVIPNNKELTIKDNRLQLSKKSFDNRSETVDTFFKSLAADKGYRCIGIVLSGTGTDGTEGVVAIKKAGGMVIVQDPATAKYDAMPRHAINTGYVDFVLTPEAMPHEILNYVKITPIAEELTGQVSDDTQGTVQEILDMVHERTGINFTDYKMPTIIRRISRRMAFNDIATLTDYLDYLNLHPEEVEVLGKEFLIGVTKFFRDQEAYAILEKEVIPGLVDGKKVADQLRVWVAGCSTGEEAYSIGILLREYMDKVKKELEVKIFASDIDREALNFAGKGMYQSSSLTDVSEERLHDHFVKEEGKYRINQRIRSMVVFAPHNVTNDPPFSKIDLVSCRNMLIYLNLPMQRKVIDKFHYSLLRGGYLFLGSSESIGEHKSFAEVSKKWKIYRNIDPTYSIGVDSYRHASLSNKPTVAVSAPALTRELPARQVQQHNFSELLNETILEESGYAAVYVDENFDILHGAGRFKNYIELPDRNFTFNLLSLVLPELATHLSTQLRKAIRTREKAAAYGIPVRHGDSMRTINVVVKPFLGDNKLYQKFILVLFSEAKPQATIDTDAQAPALGDNYNEMRVHELEIELQQTKEDLRSVVEELETANEELQSTNEELLSSNEELQSTNEELQSLNEELHTINAEHQYKIKALMELDDDLNNYFRSTDIGQIFVDRKLVIRKFTPAATHLINLIESDIGRSIYQISDNLRYEGLVDDIRHVIASTTEIEREVQDKKGTWYQLRVLPYITQDRRIDGAIVIFIQIHELKSLQLLHEGILDSSPNAILALQSVRNHVHHLIDFSFSITNRQAQQLLGRTEADLLSKTLWKEYPSLLEQGMFEKLVHVVHTGEPLETEQLQERNNQQYWMHIVALKFNDGLVLTLQDITVRKQNEQQLRRQQEEIETSASRFRTLLEAVPHITWTNKPTGENESFNEHWYEYTGLTPEESKGWGWKKAIHPEDLKHLLPDFLKALQEGKVYATQARILNRLEKQYRWNLIKVVPIPGQKGEINLWIGTATDIQDQKDAEEASMQLRLSQQREILSAVLQTQEAERTRISEALHNGLGQILYATKLNLENVNAEAGKQQDALTKVESLLTESIKVTRDISSELSPAVLKDFGLKAAVEEAISKIDGQNLKITSEIKGFDERLDYGVELSLYRIIQELLNNILKHAHATEAKITMTCQNDMVYLRVEDNGVGISDEDFRKVKGIGLNSIQNRVELLQGNMEVKGLENQGTMFQIRCKL